MPGRRLHLFFSTPPIRTMSRAKISNGAKASGASIICGHVYVSDWPGVIKAVDEAGGVAKYVGDLAPEANESVTVRGYIATWTPLETAGNSGGSLVSIFAGERGSAMSGEPTFFQWRGSAALALRLGIRWLTRHRRKQDVSARSSNSKPPSTASAQK